MNNIISALNRIPSEVNNYKEIADALERIAAKLEHLDIDKFRDETEKYRRFAQDIDKADTEEELNNILLAAYNAFDIEIPWKDDFEMFMGNKTNRLVFG